MDKHDGILTGDEARQPDCPDYAEEKKWILEDAKEEGRELTTEEKEELSKLWKRWLWLSTGVGSHYSRKKNPLYVWQTIKHCSDEGFAYPAWVCAYLADCANNLLKIESTPKRNDAAVAEAIGLKSYGGPWFAKQRKDEDERDLAVRVVAAKILHNPDRDENGIFQQVGEMFGKSKDTIRDWYSLHLTGSKYYDSK